MARMCAWCRGPISDRPNGTPSNTGDTHGMCAACTAFFLSNKPAKLREFIERLAKPVLVIDHERHVVAANQRAVEQLGKPLSLMEGRLGGEVMECASARLPGGCGKTIHCTGCALRQAVERTAASGQGEQHIHAYHDQVFDGQIRRMRVVFSTAFQEGLVHLRIDQLEPWDNR